MKPNPRAEEKRQEKEMQTRHRNIAEMIYGDELVYHRIVPDMYGRFTA